MQVTYYILYHGPTRAQHVLPEMLTLFMEFSIKKHEGTKLCGIA